MKVKFIAEYSSVDSEGNQIIVDGMDISKCSKHLFLNFDFTRKPLGPVNLSKEDGKIICETDIDPTYLSFYPSIGFVAKERRTSITGMVINQSELLSVSLCNMPNIDKSIKTIAEQIEDQKSNNK